jgi:hypothetical protein
LDYWLSWCTASCWLSRQPVVPAFRDIGIDAWGCWLWASTNLLVHACHLQATEESRGVQLIREGRAARLEAVHRSLFGEDGDKDRGRDQQQLQQLQPVGRRLAEAGNTPGRAAGSPEHSAAGRSSVDLPGGQAGGLPGRPRSLASLREGSSSVSGLSPSGRLGAGGAGLQGQRQALGGSPGGRSSTGALPGQGQGAGGSLARFRPSMDAGESK